MHRYRITFLTGLAAGFVLGARAGRERYEQLKRLSRRVADSPAAQQAAGAVQAQAAGLAQAAKKKVTDELHDRVPKVAGTAKGMAGTAKGKVGTAKGKVGTAKGKVGGHVPGLRHRNGSSGSRPAGSTEGSGDRYASSQPPNTAR
jgi:hypothetical protein